jgi:predicted GTPase
MRKPANWRTSLNHFRDEALILALLALPWVVLIPFGIIWLWQHGLVFVWVAFAALLAVGVFLLRLKLRREAADAGRAIAAEAAPASATWGPKEQAAWKRVEQLAAETEPFQFTGDAETKERITRRIAEVVLEVASHYHKGKERPELSFTVPEALRSVELIAQRLRRGILENIPLSDQATVRWMFVIADWSKRSQPRLFAAYRFIETAWRGARAVQNPMQATVQEAARALIGQVTGTITTKVRAFITAALIREVGREAIELYSGRRREPEPEELPPTDTVGPVRILLCGQTNAGKSSLLNALAGQVERQVSLLPSEQKPGEVLVLRDGRPEIILREMRGLSGNEEEIAELCAEAEQADAILWVVSVVQPARAADKTALTALRAHMEKTPEKAWPPILGVATHVDFLSPKAEWAPPYDLRDATSPKAKAMSAALAAIGGDLSITTWLPVALRAGTDAYNIEAVWAAIAHSLGAARASKIDRTTKKAGDFSVSRLWSQLAGSGRVVWESVPSIVSGRPSSSG